jgi:nucleotide-binding universal stress UspA family protein
MSDKIILVPTDFTKVGDNAIDHAVTVAKATDASIHVLHVVGNKKGLEEARVKLGALKERIDNEYGCNINTIARIGSIFEDIDEVASELDANLIIMGTHGLRGMQFITGGRALRIVTHSTTPFIIVQERGIRETGYDDIVVPLDLHKETKQKLALVADMATYFKGRVHLISPGETDEFLKNQLDRNINYAKTFLSERDVEFTVEISETKSSGFAKAVVEYAARIDADLITIMNFYENSLIGIIGGNYEQMMITNEAQIPVMCINPKDTYVMNGSVFAS